MEHRIWMLTTLLKGLTETVCQMIVYVAQATDEKTVKRGFQVLRDIIKEKEKLYLEYVPSPDYRDAPAGPEGE